MKLLLYRLIRNWPLLGVSIPIAYGLMRVMETVTGRPVTLKDFLALAVLTGASSGLVIAIIYSLWRIATGTYSKPPHSGRSC